MVEHSGTTMQDKLENLCIPHKANKTKTWRHAQLFKKGVVVNSPKQTVRSGTFRNLSTYNDFTYEINRINEYEFTVKVKVGDSMNIIKYEFAKANIHWKIMLR